MKVEKEGVFRHVGLAVLGLTVLGLAAWLVLDDAGGTFGDAAHDVRAAESASDVPGGAGPLVPDRARVPIAVPDRKAPAAAVPAVEREPDAEFGAVHGVLFSRATGTLAAGTLRLRHEGDGRVIARDVDEQGRFHFERVEPGEWLLEVVPESTPGFLVPVGQLRDTRRYSVPDEMKTHVVTVEVGAAVEHDVVVYRAASISGRVIDDRGEAVVGAWVRSILNDNSLSWFNQAAATDEHGAFVINGVYPGAIAVAITSVPADSRAATLTRPDRLEYDFVEGEERRGVELQLVQGALRLVGRLVNGWTGEPIEGHRVKVWYTDPLGHVDPKKVSRGWSDTAVEVSSDSAGSLVLNVHPDAPVKVGFTTAYNPRDEPGTGLAGYVDALAYDPRHGIGRSRREDPGEHLKPALWRENRWDPVRGRTSATVAWRSLHTQRQDLQRATPGGMTTVVDWVSRSGPEIDIGDILLWPSRPYTIKGQVDVPRGVDLDDVVVTVTRREYWVPSPQEFPHLHVPGFQHSVLKLDDDGTFSWVTQTPCGPVTLTASAPGYSVSEYPMTPEPDHVDEISVGLR